MDAQGTHAVQVTHPPAGFEDFVPSWQPAATAAPANPLPATPVTKPKPNSKPKPQPCKTKRCKKG